MKALLIAWFHPESPGAVIEHIEAIRAQSQLDIEIFNAFTVKHRIRKIFKKSLGKYGAVIFHNTITYNPAAVLQLNNLFYPSLQEFGGVKILMKQDEMRKVNETRALLKEWHISVLTTCLDIDFLPDVYGPELVSELGIVKSYTGYTSDWMLQHKVRPFRARELDVVYRGMVTPFIWGRLGHEKFFIGEEFLRRTQSTNLKVDISSQSSARIYGDLWQNFLSSSRSTLAVESGASVFDFDGSLELKINQHLLSNPNVTFEEIFELYLKNFDGKIRYNQISPRHLEAAALGTVQIMFEGDYNGIFIPDRHYISLRKDFSNLDSVLEKLRDDSFCESLIKNSKDEILTREDLKFSSFIRKLDEQVLQRSKF